MEYEPKTYFKEQEEDDVKGFTILAASDDKYHVGEKWLKQDDGDSVWMSYWIPEAQLLRRVSDGGLSDGSTTKMWKKQLRKITRLPERLKKAWKANPPRISVAAYPKE
jgi:hypothetical protein